MPIGVTNPIPPKAKKPKHVSTPRVAKPHVTKPHAPPVAHVRAPKAPHTAGSHTHARKKGSAAAEVATGHQDNANSSPRSIGGYFGTAAQVINPAAGHTLHRILRPVRAAQRTVQRPARPARGHQELRHLPGLHEVARPLPQTATSCSPTSGPGLRQHSAHHSHATRPGRAQRPSPQPPCN